MPRLKQTPGFRVRKVRFAVRLPQADEVVLTGDFTGWSADGIPLHHQGGAEWTAQLDLAPRQYEYRLRVDGDWRDDPDAARKVANPFGTQNCILTVH